jgi:diguanylate cyclase (GGDEF)-like protein/PAS domain S-box-containing protein
MATRIAAWRRIHIPIIMSELSTSPTIWHQVRRFVPPFAAALIGIALSGSAWFGVSLREDQLSELEFNARANRNLLILQNGIDNHVAVIAALRALFQSSEHDTNRREFANFTDFLLDGRSAILALSWLPRVTRGQRPAFELAAVRNGLPGYHITTVEPAGTLAPAGDHDEYFPVLYSSRASPGSPVYGLDLNDGGLRQQTLERARDGDRMATSPAFVLHSAGAGDRNGFFVVLPVYAPGRPHEALQDRRSNLTGFVEGIFQTGAMIETILATTTTPEGLDLYFFNAEAGADAPPLYFHSSGSRPVPIEALSRAGVTAGPHWTGELNPGDSWWTFIAAPGLSAPGSANHNVAWLVLAAGLLVSAVVVAYIWTTGRYARHLQAANTQLDAALSNMSQGLCMFDSSGRLILSNHRYREMYGSSPDLIKPDHTIRDLLTHRQRSGLFLGDPGKYVQNLQSTMSEGAISERLVESSDGRTISLVNHPMAGGGWVATHEDITERRRAEAKISHMALHDELTDLPNRRFFLEEIENRLAHLERDHKFAVLCFDLDRFKSVNDTLGHIFGDKLLRQVAERLHPCLREGDAVARMGGDEFAIIQGSLTEPTEITALAARLIETINAPFDLDGHHVVVGASIGIAVAPTDAADADQLLKNADMALYRAKAEGRGTYRFFEPKMDALMRARRVLELDLRKALINGEFELYYQPLVNLASDEISAFEALLRWNHPERGLVAPLEFISLAEETALVVPIGEWVLRQACREAVKWPSHISVAVNVSPAQFTRPNLSQVVMSALAGSGLAAQRLELEITESVLLLGSDSTLATLHQLRKMGVRISMDDFGTGYSSLSYLRSFPFDKIKIDRSFVHDVSSNEDSMAIIRAVTALGASLRMTTTGEGVETQEELDYLKREGCIEAQGYFFSQPKPAGEIYKMLESRTDRAKSVA